MNNLQKRIELIANIAIILVAIALVVVLAKRYVFTGPPSQNQANNQIASNLGTKVSQLDVDWSKSDKNLVLMLSNTCHFCTESAPFYKRLVEERSQRDTFQMTAVFPQTADEGRSYLTNLGVNIGDVKQLPPGGSLRVRGTPTLLLVNRSGVVTEEWLGKLPPEKENEVIARLR